MFQSKFEYTDSIVGDLGKIERYKTILDMSMIPTFIESQLKEQTKLKRTHFSTKIEGNLLDLDQVSEIIKKEDPIVKHKSEIEVRNYWDALTFLDDQKEIKTIIDEGFIKKLHYIIDNSSPGRQPKESLYREPAPAGVLFAVYDSVTREPDYIPPEAKEVPYLMKDLIQWITIEHQLPIPIKTAILSYQFLTIHPFNDGNGRTARALSTYLLSINGYDMKGFYSMEEFYAADLEGYYRNIQMNLPVLYYDGRNDPDNLSPWIEYFVRIMALAFEKVSIAVKNTRVQLEETINMENLNKKDRTLLKYMIERPNQTIRPKEIADLFGVTSRAISKWAKDWTQKGLIEPSSGEKRITSYILGKEYRAKEEKF